MRADRDWFVGCIAGVVILPAVLAIRSALPTWSSGGNTGESIANILMWLVSWAGGLGVWGICLALYCFVCRRLVKRAVNLTSQAALRAEEATSLTLEYFHYALDFSDGSIKLVDKACDEIDKALSAQGRDESIAKFSFLWGCYIGEVLRRQHGGDWIEHENEWGKILALRKNAIMIYPAEKVRKRIVNGEKESLSEYYQLYRERFAA